MVVRISERRGEVEASIMEKGREERPAKVGEGGGMATAEKSREAGASREKRSDAEGINRKSATRGRRRRGPRHEEVGRRCEVACTQGRGLAGLGVLMVCQALLALEGGAPRRRRKRGMRGARCSNPPR
jgi:hypothetical protein